MKNDMNPNPHPSMMDVHLLQVWGSLLITLLGICLHRMGPAFERSRFGPPIALLGFAAFVLQPDGLTGPEKAMHDTLLSSLPWIAAATAGTLLVLRGAPTYWSAKSIPMLLGWAAVSLAWIMILLDSDSAVASRLLSDISVLPGLLWGVIAFAFGVRLAEGFAGAGEESSPLTVDEGRLVRTILTRRLGGDGDEY
jgi:hypothetical protein